jgi:hypothetical protein
MKFNTRYKDRQYFCAEFVMSIPIQTNLKDYERLPIHIPATDSISYKITSLHHASTLIPLQQPLIPRSLRSKTCKRIKPYTLCKNCV